MVPVKIGRHQSLPNVGSFTNTDSPWDFLLPASFNPSEILPPNMLFRADEARFLANTVLRKQVTRDLDEAGYARLDSRILRRSISWRGLKPIIQILLDAGILKKRNHRRGYRSTGYCLASHVLTDWSVRQPPATLKMRQRLAEMKAEFEMQQRQRRLPIHERLHDLQLQYLTVDSVEGPRLLQMLHPEARLCQHALLSNLLHRTLGNKVSSTGRYFNGLTGVSRQLRPALRIAGEPLANVDLVSCQPALLAFAAKHPLSPSTDLKGGATYKQVPAEDSPPRLFLLPVSGKSLSYSNELLTYQCKNGEIDRFEALLGAGTFYELLMERTQRDRSFVKQRFLVDVLVSKGHYSSVIRDAFRREFPSIDRFVQIVNKHYHGQLICGLQKLESWLVIECVCPKVVDQFPVVTLHDAIFCRPADLEQLVIAFQETFQRIGFSIGLKREHCGGAVQLAA